MTDRDLPGDEAQRALSEAMRRTRATVPVATGAGTDEEVREWFVRCPKCDGTGFVVYGDEEEDNCDCERGFRKVVEIPAVPVPLPDAPIAGQFWGVVTDGHKMPCLFGHKQDAEEARDTDERVALFRVEEVAASESQGEGVTPHRALVPLPDAAPSPWRSMEAVPRDRVVDFWIMPKPDDEAYADTSGRVISAAGSTPRRHTGRYGSWGCLWKPTHWKDVDAPPGASSASPAKERP